MTMLTWVELKVARVRHVLWRVPRAPDLAFSNGLEATRERDEDRHDNNLSVGIFDDLSALKEGIIIYQEQGERDNSSNLDNHRRDFHDTEDVQRDLGRMIASLTKTSSDEDWAEVFDVCERVSTTEADAKQATEALSREFKCGEAQEQLSAARLWVVMLLNSSELFVNQCTKSEFMDTLEDVLNSQRTSPVVRKNLLEVLTVVAYASARTSNKSESSFLVLWRKVKPAGKPDEAMPFDPDNTTIDFPPLQKNAIISTTPGDLPINPQLLQAAWPTDIDSILYAMRLEREFDEENLSLSAQRPKPDSSSKCLFECGVCFDEMPLDSIVQINSCGHIFCLGCLRGHVTARLDERRFPILCPTCAAGKGKDKGNIGEVPQSLVLNLGLTNEQFSIWTEMEMAAISVLLHCRKCQRSMNVARSDYEEAKVIVCPLPKCDYAWCKQCEQSVDHGGPTHTCDGTSELDHLMKLKGWKYCPKCKTPIEKISGCGHVRCTARGCNRQFDYYAMPEVI